MKNTRARKSLRLVFSVLVCFAMMATSCFAHRIDYIGGNTDITLSGKTEEAIAGQIVTLKVMAEVEGSDEVVFTRQTETNGLGEYSFVFDVSNKVSSGDLDITVNAGGETHDDGIYKSTSTEVSDALIAVNDKGLYDAINDDETVAKILQIKETVLDGGIDILDTYVNTNKPYADFPGFRTVYKKGLLLQSIKNGAADNELYALLEDSGMASLLTGKASEVFAAYGESNKKVVLSKLKGNGYTTDAAFKKALTEAVIINELSKGSTYNEKWAALSRHNDYLAMNLSKYESMSKFTEFKEELFKKGITSIAVMKSNAETLYSKLNQSGNAPGGGVDRDDRETVSVSGGLVKPPAPAVTFGFSDLAGYDWAKDAILTLAADGVINGKSQGIFAPADNVTRAEFAKIIVGAFGLTDRSATADFADTPEGHWSYSYVASAVANRIVTGVSENSFNPDGKITRQDMATICYRALTSLGIETDASGAVIFADAANISDYAKDAVAVLSSLGIINGKGNNQFAPNDFATRAEAAKVVHMLRALN